VSTRYWKLRQIFRRKINIREDKLLLYHCLLELGLPKVNVSEHLWYRHGTYLYYMCKQFTFHVTILYTACTIF
jgi:hypothetical protein